MCRTLRDINEWKVSAVYERGLWTVSASCWCDDEETDGPTLERALERLANMIGVDSKELLRTFGF